jgi:hypothetical protein
MSLKTMSHDGWGLKAIFDNLRTRRLLNAIASRRHSQLRPTCTSSPNIRPSMDRNFVLMVGSGSAAAALSYPLIGVPAHPFRFKYGLPCSPKTLAKLAVRS